MAQEIQIIEKKPTGQLSIKHKAAVTAVGALLIWLGRRLMNVDTYEELDELVNRAESEFQQLEAEHGENLKMPE